MVFKRNLRFSPEKICFGHFKAFSIKWAVGWITVPSFCVLRQKLSKSQFLALILECAKKAKTTLQKLAIPQTNAYEVYFAILNGKISVGHFWAFSSKWAVWWQYSS